MCCRQLQDQVYALATFSSVFSLLVGIIFVVYGVNVEMTIVGTVLNVSITGALFYGVKRNDTTHIFIWIVFSVIEVIFSIIIMCYLALQSDNMLKKYNHLLIHQSYESNVENLERVWNQRISYLAFSTVFGFLTVSLLTTLLTVKKFYDELSRRGNYQSYGR